VLKNFLRERTPLGTVVVLVGIGVYLYIGFLIVEWAMIRRIPPAPSSSLSLSEAVAQNVQFQSERAQMDLLVNVHLRPVRAML